MKLVIAKLFYYILGINLIFLVFNSSMVVARNLDDKSLLRERVKTKIDSTHSRISQTIIRASLKLDKLLGLEDYIEDTSASNIRVKVRSTNSRFNGYDFSTSVSSKLSLPSTEKRFQLFINNLRDDLMKNKEEQSGESDGVDRPPVNEGFVAGLRHMFFDSDSFQIHSDAGIRLGDPIDPFLKLRFRESFEFGLFATHFFQQAQTYMYSGYGYNFGVIFDRQLNINFHLRQTNLANYNNLESFYRFEHGLSLIQQLGSNKVLVYFIRNNSLANPVHIASSYSLGVSYRTPIIYKWMTLEVQPSFNYARFNDFSTDPGILIQLETTFGTF